MAQRPFKPSLIISIFVLFFLLYLSGFVFFDFGGAMPSNIPNGSFEDDLSYWNDMDGVYAWSSTTHEGDPGGSAVNTAGDYHLLQYQTRFCIVEDVPVTITAWFKGGSGTSAEDAIIKLAWSDPNNILAYITVEVQPDEWRQATLSFTPYLNTCLFLYLGNDHAGGLIDQVNASGTFPPTPTPSPTPIPGALEVYVTDSQGNDVSALIRDEETGWPMRNAAAPAVVANPLTVTVSFNCPSGGSSCDYPFNLAVHSPDGTFPRFYLDTKSERGGTNCAETVTEISLHSYSDLSVTCTNNGSNMDVPAGGTATITWPNIWIQPSQAATLEARATWGPYLDYQDVDIPEAKIHPVVFLHGILGAMPPKNSVITHWPQPEIFIGEAWLDPFLWSYSPLIENLLKMGLEIDKTLFPTTYDWRQSNQISACWLRDVLANTVQSQAAIPYVIRDAGGAIDADVIVHSMGGIVLRSYLEDMGYRRWTDNGWQDACPYNEDVNKAVFIASPHRGFPVTYNTREGMTWKDYLNTEVSPNSNTPVESFPLYWLMDNVLWPFLVVKQYAPTPLEPCWRLDLSNIVELDDLTASDICAASVRYVYSHSTQAKADHFRGIRSLAEMLPTGDTSVYLIDSTNGSSYPYGREVNPLLDGTSGLNGNSGIATLLNHVPAENMYVIYTNDQPTVESYNVFLPIPHEDCYGVYIGGVCVGLWFTYTPWSTGSLAGDPNLDDTGDDLIPQYSTNLGFGNNPLIALPEDHELAVNRGRHKLVVSHPRTQIVIADILTGYDEPINVINLNHTFPITSSYAAPDYLLDNWGAISAFLFFSPVDGLVTDPAGRRVGYDPAGGQVVNEIPGAFYSGNDTDMEFILIPGHAEGDYTVTTMGTGDGPYTVLAARSGATGVELIGSVQGQAAPGQINTATVTYEPVVAQVLFEDTDASGPWTAAGGWAAVTDDGSAAPPAWASDGANPPLPDQPATLTLNTPLDLTTARQVRFTFSTKSTLAAGAEAAVEISTDTGNTWTVIDQISGSHLNWEKHTFDLTLFAQWGTPPVLLRFRLVPATTTDRWLVDDIRLKALETPTTFSLPFADHFEGWRRWDVAGGWAWSNASSQSPSHAWHSETAGNILTLAGTMDLAQATHPQLTFWQTLEANTVGLVEVSTDGQTWTSIHDSFNVTGWEQVTVDLSVYSGSQLHLRFKHLVSGGWTVDDVQVQDVPPPVIYPLPFNDDMESAVQQWQGINGWQTTTNDFHSPQTSWHSNTADSALKLLGEFDLTSGNGLAVTFWHKFDLPPGSLGTVEASGDGGVTWQPVYTQTTSLLDWTPVTLDLGRFAGHKVTLAFFLQEVGTGSFAGDETGDKAALTPATTHTTLVDTFWPFSLMVVGGTGLALVDRKRRYRYLVLCLVSTGLLTTLVGCIQVGPSPDFDYNKLDLVQGEVELIIPAEQRIFNASMSPDNKWLFFSWEKEWGKERYSLLNLETNQLYENLGRGSTGQWLDHEHIRIGGRMLRVSDMVQWSLEPITPEPGTLGALEAAEHIYAIDGFGSTYSFLTTDPNLPYLMISNFGADAGIPNEELAAFLADRPHTIVMRDTSAGHNGHPVYSPDGQYYLEDGPFDDPTHNLTQAGGVIYDARTNQEIAYGYKYGWNTRFLGWANDSSGVYIWFSPRSPDGDLLYDRHPIYKILVPGAEKQDLPVLVAITPSPLSTVAPAGQSTVWEGNTEKAVLYRSAAQTGNAGWYIDDVSAVETPPPTPTPTPPPTNTPTPTPTNTPDPTYATCEYREVGGTVVIEAEHYASQVAGSGNAQWSSWVDTTHKAGYSGSRAIFR